MPTPEVRALLQSAFPFHLVFDRDLRLLGVGRSLPKICPAAVEGAALLNVARLLRPKGVRDAAGLIERSDQLFLLQIPHNGVQLRGQVIALSPANPASTRFVFIGSPWVTNLETVAGLGLTLADFAVHDPIAEFALLLRTRDMALDDAQMLTKQLERERRGLPRPPPSAPSKKSSSNNNKTKQHPSSSSSSSASATSPAPAAPPSSKL